LVHQFQSDDQCRLFISTNAGATGLNLQAANTVINCDLPWNPAVLEQRIARAHRMGQKHPVQAYLLVTEDTLEANLLGTLTAKKDLALAALDSTSKVEEVSLVSGAEDLRNRLEVLLGAKPEASVDESQKSAAAEAAGGRLSHRDRVAAAGGEMLGAVFGFLGELVSQDQTAPAPAPHVVSDLKQRLEQCTEQDEQGRPRLSLTLPNRDALDQLAKTLAQLMIAR
jgi:superfamily II DNA/RNA helicase